MRMQKKYIEGDDHVEKVEGDENVETQKHK